MQFHHPLTEAAVAVVVASGGLLPIMKALTNWWGRHRHEKGLRSIRKIYQTLNVLLTGMGANRVCVFDSCNGGATPHAGSRLTAQTVYEINAVDTPGGRALWSQKVPIDYDLLDKLITLSDGKPHSWLTSDMDEGLLEVMAKSMDSDKVILQRVGMDDKCQKVLAVFLPTSDELPHPQEQLLSDVAGVLRTVPW